MYFNSGKDNSPESKHTQLRFKLNKCYYTFSLYGVIVSMVQQNMC